MIKQLIISGCLLTMVTACADYTPTEKSMVSTQEKVFHYGLVEETFEIEPYAWEELENALKPMPLKYMEEVEIITNRPEFIHTDGYEKVQLAIWRKGLESNQVLYTAFKGKNPASVKVAVRYRGISYPKRCSDWRHSPIINHDNSAMSNFGCASTINLGHMLSNQNDLLESRGQHHGQMESSVAAIEKFYQGGLTQTTPNSSISTTE
ncbi:MAG: CpaD family pilus assembly lipoprotein [Rickettsiales bacterium]|nr:CpaD family pilus assembly lipoprotein [Rickettsiales bacterium]